MEKLKELKQNLDHFKNSIEELRDMPALVSNFNALVYEPVTELLKELGHTEDKPHPFVELDPDCQTC